MTADEATLRQHQAADPGASTWLSANAGSGKTRVLTDRVARLLLNRVRPENILCLTYTKAAAGEMQNRLFQTLGNWAMLPDAKLRSALTSIGAPDQSDLRQARTLFARALETPGGLKIQTIHSFCSALLRQFPLEAGIAPGFQEIDEATQLQIIEELLDRLAESDQSGAVEAFVALIGGTEAGGVAKQIIEGRAGFPKSISRHQMLKDYGISGDTTIEMLWSSLRIDTARMARLIATCDAGSTRDCAAAEKLRLVDFGNPTMPGLEALEKVFLTGSGAKPPFGSKAGRFPTKDARKAIGEDIEELDRLMNRIERIRPDRIALVAAERTLTIHRFANIILPAYAAEKKRRGMVDFDDLIQGALRVLSDTEGAAWVRYKLDARIEHILVDEAQDTSASQWRIIELLSDDFWSEKPVGRALGRSLFIVGDKKQSIYSFQGANAEMFDDIKSRFRSRMLSGTGLQSLQLDFSFRSSSAILETVDAAFDPKDDPWFGAETRHRAFFEAFPGRVDLWPIVTPPKDAEPAKWYDPVDRPAPDSPSNILANRIAAEIERLVTRGKETLPLKNGTRRQISFGDFLILVQRRTGSDGLFRAIIRALKAKDLPIAGADRLRLTAELAVRDLTALCAFLALPEDDLSLAAALRSPLFGWSETELFKLAARRKEKYLWATLRAEFENTETFRVLSDLRNAADFLRPFDLLERILIRHDGRRKLLARLGSEAEDGIDELLIQALNYEKQNIPDLTGFLSWLEGEAVEVKRRPESGQDKIQIMTVHGSKGLERPIVILPETLRGERTQGGRLITDAKGIAHWQSPTDTRPTVLQAMEEHRRTMDARERQRLLYVAMTRAENWLIVCGAGNDEASDGTWYQSVRNGMTSVGDAPLVLPFGEGRRLETGDWLAGPVVVSSESERDVAMVEHWMTAPPPPVRGTPIRAPSDLGGAKIVGGLDHSPDSQADALRKGRQIHRLLEHLPPHPQRDHVQVARDLLAFGEDAASEQEAANLAVEVGALMENPEISWIFDPSAMTEVDLTATLHTAGGIRIHGVIDRLILEPDKVIVIDFKTNRDVPKNASDVPEGVLRQAGAYRMALEEIYADRTIEVGILWTSDARYMPLPNDIVIEALRRMAIS